MKQLVILGAGGMGRTVYGIAMESIGYGNDFTIKGFIDDDINSLNGYPNYPPIIGKISEYNPNDNDVFISSIGGGVRKKCIDKMVTKGAHFINIIHETARIRTNAKLGIGNVICPYVSIGADSVIGDYNMIQPYTTIGHDVQVGNYNRIDTHVTCVGGVRIENEVDIYTSAVLNHGVIIEDGAHVGACSFVIKKVKAGTTVFGVPAKKLI
jgi:sugar O-acyltransferase (sialic acid O-acetyltransferase NeuD family)